ATAQAAADELSLRGLLPVRIFLAKEERSQGKSESSLWDRLSAVGSVPLRRKTLFYRQFAVLAGAGIPLGNVLTDLSRGESYRPLARRIEIARRCVAAGEPLNVALREARLADEMESALLAAGEESGKCAETLDMLAQACERQSRLRGRVRSAMVYPAFVLVLSGAVLAVMFRWVLPRFQDVFARMDMELPALTKALFHVSGNFRLWTAAALLGVFLLTAAALFLRRIGRVRFLFDWLRLKTPVLGRIVRCSALSRGFRSLGVMLASGVPLLRALEFAGKASGNAVIEGAFDGMREAALHGAPLGSAAGKHAFFKPVAFQLMSAGERSGSLDAMLVKAAEWYESDLEEAVKRLGAALEPLLTLLVGGVAALVAAGLFAPVLQSVRELSAGM
ncbi:MAG: type II secretion system F family protein, partial [Pyramidobacter sp.]|nr:type II secretion system F family protein [Pyramidobacter sp.]